MMIKGNKIHIILIAIFALMLFASVVFFMVNKQNKTDQELINFAPKDSSIYLEFDWQTITASGLNNQIKNEINNFVVKNEFPTSLTNFSGLQKVGLVLVNNRKNNALEKSWLVRAEKVKRAEAADLSGYYFSIINQNTAVVSQSLEAMRTVRDRTAINQAGAYGQNLPAQSNCFLSGFIQNSKLSDLIKDNIPAHKLLSDYFKLKPDQISYGQACFNQSNSTVDFKITLAADTAGRIIKMNEINLPAPLVKQAITINGFNGGDLIEILKNEINQSRDNGWQLLQTYMENKYKIDINVLQAIFEQPGALVIRPKNTMDGREELFKIDDFYYGLVLKNNLAGAAAETGISNLEKLAQNYLAFKYPSIKNKILPDKTVGLELAAEPAPILTEIDRNKNEIKTISQKSGAEFSYTIKDEKIIFSNSKNLISDILSSADNIVDSAVAIDPAIVEYDWLDLFSFIGLNSEIAGGRLIISGQMETAVAGR